MEKVYAFTDEYGAFGWDLDKPNVSTHFIITAIIVEESKLESVRSQAEIIRKKNFQTSEIKSSKVGSNHKRRARILNELLKLDFTIFPVVIDKKGVLNYPGLKYKKSFYKFMNNIVHKELRKAFSNLTVVADAYGSNDYMDSFKEYFQNNSEPKNLLGESELLFEDSKHDVLVQIADFISGTLAYVYDEHKKGSDSPDYLKMLNVKLSYVKLYPKTYETFVLNGSAIAEEYDKDIAELCFKQAAVYFDFVKFT